MASIVRTRLDTSPEGQKLVKVTFTPHVPNPAQQADIEVVYEVMVVQSAMLDADPFALVQLSATREDTREPYTLSREQREAVVEAATLAVAEEDE
jgi:hypothetical protein